MVDARGPEAVAADRGAGLPEVPRASSSRLDAPAAAGRGPIVMDATVAQTRRLPLRLHAAPGARSRAVEDTYYSDSPDARPRRPPRAGARATPRHSGCEVARGAARGDGRASHPLGGERRPDPTRRAAARGLRRAASSIPPPATRCRWPCGWPSTWPPAPPEEAGRRPSTCCAREHGARRASAGCSTGCSSAPTRRTQRWHVLERFYRLPEATIRRFYALRADPGRPGPAAPRAAARPASRCAPRVSRWQAA